AAGSSEPADAGASAAAASGAAIGSSTATGSSLTGSSAGASISGASGVSSAGDSMLTERNLDDRSQTPFRTARSIGLDLVDDRGATVMPAVSPARTSGQGTPARGSGPTSLASGVVPPLDVTWSTRTERAAGATSPEELIAAAHASCYAMALSHELAE